MGLYPPDYMESFTANNSSFPAKLLIVTQVQRVQCSCLTINDFAVQTEIVAVETSIDVGNILSTIAFDFLSIYNYSPCGQLYLVKSLTPSVQSTSSSTQKCPVNVLLSHVSITCAASAMISGVRQCGLMSSPPNMYSMAAVYTAET